MQRRGSDGREHPLVDDDRRDAPRPGRSCATTRRGSSRWRVGPRMLAPTLAASRRSLGGSSAADSAARAAPRGRSARPATRRSRPGPRARPARAPAGERRRRCPGPGAAPPRRPRTPRAAAASRGCARPRRRPCARPTAPAAGARACGVGKRVEHQVAIGRRAALPVDTLELGAARKSATARRSRLHRAGRPQVERRLRPLSRRRFSVSRPRACACGHETRGHGRACASLAGRCASSSGFSTLGRIPATIRAATASASKYRPVEAIRARADFSRQLRPAGPMPRTRVGYSRRTGPFAALLE